MPGVPCDKQTKAHRREPFGGIWQRNLRADIKALVEECDFHRLLMILGHLAPSLVALTEEAALMDLTAASNTFLGRRRLVVPLSTMLLS